MLSFYLSLAKTEEAGDKITCIYNEYYTFMVYVAKKYIKNEHDVEDIVHDCMIRIIECIDNLDFFDDSKTKSFCGIVARNRAIDFCKSKENKKLTLEDKYYMDPFDKETPSELVIQKDTCDIILKAIYSLSDTYRDVCFLKYVHELKEKEIADLLGLPATVVNMRICRGKHILRDLLRKENLHV